MVYKDSEGNFFLGTPTAAKILGVTNEALRKLLPTVPNSDELQELNRRRPPDSVVLVDALCRVRVRQLADEAVRAHQEDTGGEAAADELAHLRAELRSTLAFLAEVLETRQRFL